MELPSKSKCITNERVQFTDDYLRQGLDGGKRAANALRNAILQHRSFDLSESTEIIVKICANLSGLSQALKRDGAIDNPLDLRQFSLGFNQAKASFDYLDVGRGKERADSKLKGGFLHRAYIWMKFANQSQSVCAGIYVIIIANI